MLRALRIQNLGLLERAELELAPGLNVVTGETGAGKTMVAQAVALLVGGAPARGLVGPRGDEAWVEAEFDVGPGFLDDPALAAVAELRPDGEEGLVVARRLARSGRTRAFVWGRACARADLEALGERLVEIASQHEARRLTRPSFQLEALDAHAGNAPLLAQMAERFAELRAARAALEAAERAAEEAERRRGDLEELAARVESAAVEPGEREALAHEAARLRHVDELLAAAAGAGELLNPEEGEGALALVARAADLVAGAERFERRLEAVGAELRDAAIRLQEAALELRSYAQELEADPARLEAVEARLELFAALERRYGAPLEEVVARGSEARRALEGIASFGDERRRLAARAEEALEAAQDVAERLRRARAGGAGRFARAVEEELADLGMGEARLHVRLSRRELGERGIDEAALELAANPGLEAGPLGQAASGGELSRVALAVRIASRMGGGPGLLVLDEVDAGVGGRTAVAVGEKLRRLADDAQLLVVTHLPQVARLADAHFRVEKRAGEPSAATVAQLDRERTLDELVRMLGGDDGDEAARRHAAALRG